MKGKGAAALTDHQDVLLPDFDGGAAERQAEPAARDACRHACRVRGLADALRLGAPAVGGGEVAFPPEADGSHREGGGVIGPWSLSKTASWYGPGEVLPSAPKEARIVGACLQAKGRLRRKNYMNLSIRKGC